MVQFQNVLILLLVMLASACKPETQAITTAAKLETKSQVLSANSIGPNRAGASIACANEQVLFHCTTENNKEILLCDQRKTLRYSFGKEGRTPELVLSVPREAATTSKWKGIGRWIDYSITIPNGDTGYTVFTSLDRISDAHEFEAGVVVNADDKEIGRVLCKESITHHIDDIDLKQEE